jgi:hypothetical protein
MKRSPFNPTLVVHTHKKTMLAELLLNRLPKAITVFESARWEKEIIPLACHNSQIILLFVTPTSCDIQNMDDYEEIITDYGHKVTALVSNNSERGIQFTKEEIDYVVDKFNSRGIKTFTSLNHFASSIRGSVHYKGNKSHEHNGSTYQHSGQLSSSAWQL